MKAAEKTMHVMCASQEWKDSTYLRLQRQCSRYHSWSGTSSKDQKLMSNKLVKFSAELHILVLFR